MAIFAPAESLPSPATLILCTIYGILLRFTLFWWKTFFRWQFTLFCRKSILRFTHFCVEKNLAKNSAREEKMTNMRFGWKPPTIYEITTINIFPQKPLNPPTIKMKAYLIFVAGRQARPVEKKSVMWRNFKILYMKHVEKAKICPHVD